MHNCCCKAKLPIEKVTAQLSTIRHYMTDIDQFAASMDQIVKIGYKAIQLSAAAHLDYKQVQRICAERGLTITSTHDGKLAVTNFQQAVDRLGELGCTQVAYAFPHLPFASEYSAKHLAGLLNQTGEKLRQQGITFSYHNHNVEFFKIGDKTVLDLIYEETDPQNLQGEPDTYWIQAGGGCSVNWVKRLAAENRLPLLHMKDYGINANNSPCMREIGRGNLNWQKIVSNALAGDCLWFIIEQDENWIDNDPFASLKASYDWIKDNLCQ